MSSYSSTKKIACPVALCNDSLTVADHLPAGKYRCNCGKYLLAYDQCEKHYLDGREEKYYRLDELGKAFPQ